MNGPRKLTAEETDELLGAIDAGPGAPIPGAWARWQAQFEEHRKSAAPDCQCIQCAIDRGELCP